MFSKNYIKGVLLTFFLLLHSNSIFGQFETDSIINHINIDLPDTISFHVEKQLYRDSLYLYLAVVKPRAEHKRVFAGKLRLELVFRDAGTIKKIYNCPLIPEDNIEIWEHRFLLPKEESKAIQRIHLSLKIPKPMKHEHHSSIRWEGDDIVQAELRIPKLIYTQVLVANDSFFITQQNLSKKDFYIDTNTYKNLVGLGGNLGVIEGIGWEYHVTNDMSRHSVILLHPKESRKLGLSISESFTGFADHSIGRCRSFLAAILFLIPKKEDMSEGTLLEEYIEFRDALSHWEELSHKIRIYIINPN